MKIRLLVCEMCIDLLQFFSSKQVELYTVLLWVELSNWFFVVLALKIKQKKQKKNVKGSVIVGKHKGLFFSGLNSKL